MWTWLWLSINYISFPTYCFVKNILLSFEYISIHFSYKNINQKMIYWEMYMFYEVGYQKSREVLWKNVNWGNDCGIGLMVCQSPLVFVHKSQQLNFQEFSKLVDVTLVTWNCPWWEYLHHKNRQMLQLRDSSHPHESWLLSIYQCTIECAILYFIKCKMALIVG